MSRYDDAQPLTDVCDGCGQIFAFCECDQPPAEDRDCVRCGERLPSWRVSALCEECVRDDCPNGDDEADADERWMEF